jgi:hypothetical protein
VELSLITQCQSWICFAGCHQQIKGWHTFFKGRPTDNVGNIMLLTECGWKGTILVVMCGPFTSKQNRIKRENIGMSIQNNCRMELAKEQQLQVC